MELSEAKNIGDLATKFERRRDLLAELQKSECQLALRAGVEWGGREVIVSNDDPEYQTILAAFQRAVTADIKRLDSLLAALFVKTPQDRSA